MADVITPSDMTRFPAGSTYNFFPFYPGTGQVGAPTATVVDVAGVITATGLTAGQLYKVEVATNLCTNPDIETNATGWANTATDRNTTGATVTRTTSKHLTGSAALSVVTGATATGKGADFGTVSMTSGVTYRLSCYVLGNAGSESVKVSIGDNTVGLTTSSAQSLSSSSWTRFDARVTAGATGTSGVAVVSAAASNITFFVDNISIEAESTRDAGNYFFYVAGTASTSSADPTQSHPVKRRGGVVTLV